MDDKEKEGEWAGEWYSAYKAGIKYVFLHQATSILKVLIFAIFVRKF